MIRFTYSNPSCHLNTVAVASCLHLTSFLLCVLAPLRLCVKIPRSCVPSLYRRGIGLHHQLRHQISYGIGKWLKKRKHFWQNIYTSVKIFLTIAESYYILYTFFWKVAIRFGRVAQLARVTALQAVGHRFEPCPAYQPVVDLSGSWCSLAEHICLSRRRSRVQIPSSPPTHILALS